jgi:hypothetical protein
VITLQLVVCQDPACSRVLALCTLCNVPRHRYCDTDCSRRARRARQREAGRTYQQSWSGRLCHALRQRRYRERRKNVTHQLDRIERRSAMVASTSPPRSPPLSCCARCGRIGVLVDGV